jgi:hypothetical protein
MRPQEATPTVTATLTAMSQIFVRIVTARPSGFYAPLEDKKNPRRHDSTPGKKLAERNLSIAPRQG